MNKTSTKTLEEAINSIIENGNEIAVRLSGIGTILPTKFDLERADKHADNIKAKAICEAKKELPDLEMRIVGGEVRFYKTPTIYTPAVKRCGVRRWFEVRNDGDYSISHMR